MYVFCILPLTKDIVNSITDSCENIRYKIVCLLKIHGTNLTSGADDCRFESCQDLRNYFNHTFRFDILQCGKNNVLDFLYLQACTYVFVSMYVPICKHMHMYLQTYAYVSANICICICKHMHCICKHMLCICKHKHMYMQT
jgi:hypothetical protein